MFSIAFRRFVLFVLVLALLLSVSFLAAADLAVSEFCVDRVEEGRWAVIELPGSRCFDVAGYAVVPVGDFLAAAGFYPAPGRRFFVPAAVLVDVLAAAVERY